VGDRGIYKIMKDNVYIDAYLASRNDLDDYVLHHPYPHQMWEKVDWRDLDVYVNKINGTVNITDRFDFDIIADLETALLKALAWQMENK